MDNQKLGIFITELRKEKGLTQAQLAQKLNVTDKLSQSGNVVLAFLISNFLNH